MSIATTTSAQWIYTIGYSNQAQKDYLQRINVQTLEVVDVVNLPPPGYGDIAFHPNGKLYGVRATTLALIDTLTGQNTNIYSHPSFDAVGLSIDHLGSIYLSGWNYTTSNYEIVRLDINNGEMETIASFPLVEFSFINDLDFFEGQLYVMNLLPPTFDRRMALFKVDTAVSQNHDTIVNYQIGNVHALASISDSCGSIDLVSPGNERIVRFIPDQDTSSYLEVDYMNYRAGGATSLTSYIGSIPPLRIDNISIAKDPCDSNALADVIVQIREGRPPAVEYSLDDMTYQDSAHFTNITPGTYQAFVRDAWGCSRMSDPFTIDPTGGFDIEVTLSSAYCAMANGAISVIAKRPEDSLVFAVDQLVFQVDTIFTDLAPGDHALYIQNSSGCVDSLLFSIACIDPPLFSAVSSPEYCDQRDGTIQVIATGGEKPYTYAIEASPTQTDSVFTGLNAGSYAVSITDAMGCEMIEIVTIDSVEGPALQDIVVQDAHCDQADGMIDIVATSDMSTLRYAIDGGPAQDLSQFTGLVPGMHTLTVLDTFGCETEETFIVTSLPGPVIEGVSITDAHCGMVDATIEVVASGEGPLEYAIDNGTYSLTAQFAGLTSGDHVISVLDVFGCIEDSLVTIGLADGPMIEGVSITDAHCGMSDATIEVVASGDGPLEYAVDNGTYSLTSQFAGLTSGDHTLSVRDVFGCAKDTTISIGTIDGPVIEDLIAMDAHCGLADGALEIIATGGTGVLTYEINGGTSATTPQFEDLSGGVYEVTVQDTTGCSTKQFVQIENLPGVQITSIEKNDTGCDGTDGLVTIETENGDGVVYSTDGINYQSDATLSNLIAGMYWIYAQDQYGCRDSLSVEIDQPLPEIENVFAESAGCTGKEGRLVVSYYASKGPFTFSLDGINYQASHVFEGLEAGSYTVIVRNDIGCELLIDMEVPALVYNAFGPITTVAATCGESDGIVQLNPSPAIINYSFDGMIATAGGEFSGLMAGSYRLEYTDTSGCEREQSVEVAETECGIYVPNVFSPNGDGINDTFFPFYSEERYTFESLSIFDRWGDVVLVCTDPCSWDGGSGSQFAAAGVYVYALLLGAPDGEVIRIAGDITLVR